MFGSILVFLLVLSILVLIHEFGHFWTARRAGVWVEEFGLGLPPRLFGKKIGDTIYSLNAIPFGGFVRLHGESSEEGVTQPERAFLNKDKKTRAIILTAGVFMNFVLAIVSFAVVYSFTGIPRDTGEVRIAAIAPQSPAQDAGFQQGDVIMQIDKESVDSNLDFISKVDERKGQQTEFVLKREVGGEIQEVAVQTTPRMEPPEGQGPLGVAVTSTEQYFPPVWQRPFLGVYYGFRDALFWGGAILGGLGNIFSQLFTGQVPQDVAGPVGIFAITTEATRMGIFSLIHFVGIFSVNLAILNIMPFPALDGGRLLFVLIESLIGKKVLPKAEAIMHAVGMAILLTLLFALTAYDIRRLIDAGGITGFIDTFLR